VPNWQLEVFDGYEGKVKFTAEFKLEAVKLAEQPGRSLTEVARDLGAPPCA